MTNKKKITNFSGAGLVFGAAIGTVLYTLTHQALFIGLCAGLGIVFGSALGTKK